MPVSFTYVVNALLMIVAVPPYCVSPIFLVSKLLKDLTNLIVSEPYLSREANEFDVMKFSQLTPTSCNPIESTLYLCIAHLSCLAL